MAEAEVAVIGAGVFGLCIARACGRAGLRTVVVEAADVGAGASGGPVGALVPHQPRPWRPIKAFQLAALASLPDYMADLARGSGRDPGYARIGRLVPLSGAAARARAESQVLAASAWEGAARLAVRDHAGDDWLAAPGAGVMVDDLSARVTPAHYLAALAAGLGPLAELRPGWRCDRIAPGRVEGPRGTLTARHIVIAAGAQAFALAATPGMAVKGQAALLRTRAPLPAAAGLIAIEGVYIVPHGQDLVAVGSTSEAAWDSPGPDGRLDALIARAAAICPALQGAEVLTRWAGLRPKAPGGHPLVGPLPGAPGVILATGGYKIGIGIAHLVAEAVLAQILGTAPAHPLPPDTAPS